MGTSSGSTVVRTAGLVALGIIVGSGAVIGFSSLTDKGHAHGVVDPLASGDFKNPSKDGGRSQDASMLSNTPNNGAVTDLNDLDQVSSEFARTAALHNLLLNATEDQLEGFLNQSREIASVHRRHAVERTIVQRLTATNPKRALSHIAGLPDNRYKTLVSTVFREWASADLDNAVTHAKSLDQQHKLEALKGILQARGDLSVDLQQQIAKQLDNEHYAQDRIEELTVVSATQNAEESWRKLVDDNHDNAAQLAGLLGIAEELVDQHGIQAIEIINESLRDRTVRRAVLRSTLHRIAQSNPQETFHQAMSLSRDLRDTALRTIVEVWAQEDPLPALTSIGSLKANSLRRSLQELVLEAWASRDPNGLFDSLELLPKELHSTGELEAMVGVARSSPSDAVKFLSGMTDSTRRSALANAIASSWASLDVYGALDWALSVELEDERLHRNVLSHILRELVKVDPDLAMQTALSQPIGRFNHGLETVILVDLAQLDLDKAIVWLSEVRDGRTKASAYRNIGQALVEDGEFDRALKLGEQLEERYRRNYLSSIYGRWAQLDPHSLFESIDRISDTNVKALAALQLVVHNSRVRSLDVNQINHLTSLFSDGVSVDGHETFVIYDRESAEGAAANLDVLRMTLEQVYADTVMNEMSRSVPEQ